METELRQLQSSRSSRSLGKPSLSSISIRDEQPVAAAGGGGEAVRYTSLKDVFSALDDSPNGAGHSSSIHDFSSSTISIKNQLVKHAASAYLQSAAIIAARDRNWLARVWRQTRQPRRVLGSRWQDCVRGPVGLCIGLVMRAVRTVVARAATHVVAIRARSTSSSPR